MLRGWEPSDRDAVYAYASDPLVTEHMDWDRHTSASDATTFLDEIVAPKYEKKTLTYALGLKEAPERAIGGVEVVWNPEAEKVLELGYVLHKEFWGQGLMEEACLCLLSVAWTRTQAARIFAPIMTGNWRSRRLAEKLDLHLDGILRSHISRRGERRDVAIYSQLRGE